jgi:hypothetical protein
MMFMVHDRLAEELHGLTLIAPIYRADRPASQIDQAIDKLHGSARLKIRGPTFTYSGLDREDPSTGADDELIGAFIEQQLEYRKYL